MTRKQIVGISKVESLTDYQKIKENLYELLDLLNKEFPLNIPAHAKVFIKPNICFVKGFETGATVDPNIIEFLVDWLLQKFDIDCITIGEADATELNLDIAFKVLGWEDFFSQNPKVQLLNISKDSLVDVNCDGLFLKNIEISKTYLESDFLISVAKLKTHTMTGITGNLKNIYGANPIKNKVQYHTHLDEVICDMNSVRISDLCIVDGIIAMEGKGPINGIPNPIGLLIIGTNPVATDHACARIMGFNPKKISHLELAISRNLGPNTYKVIGMNIKQVMTKFKFIPLWNRIALNVYQNKFFKNIACLKLSKKRG